MAGRWQAEPCRQTPAACIPRSSCFSSLISSRKRAAISNCSSAAAVCIWSVSCVIVSITSCRAGPAPGAGRQTGHRALAPALLPAAATQQFRGVGVLPDELVQDVGDPLTQRLRIDTTLGVVGDLLLTPPVRLLDGPLHG